MKWIAWVVMLVGSVACGQRVVAVDATRVAGPHSQVPLRMVGAGRANEGLRADWQAQLAEVQREIGFDYIRMHGILSDDMGVYREDAAGKPQYNFQYVDSLYDALLKLHIRPFVELGFMPGRLASGTQTIFWWKGNVTPPKDYDKWAGLMQAIVRHWVERYGAGEVHRWYFEVWNEPDIKPFWTGTLEDYLKLYRVTAEAIKAVCAECRVGGPANAIPYAAEMAFEKFVVDEKLPVDFVSAHAYGVKSGFLDADGTAGTVIDPGPEIVSGRMIHSRALMDAAGLKGKELHFTEWSSAYTPTDFMHDQYHQASFMLEKIRRAAGSVDSMSYWTFTDIFEENGPRFTPFHGGFGMMNLEGIKKPSYYAYRFLRQLGTEDLVSSDASSWVTRTADGGVQALVWDYSPVVPPAGENDQTFYKQDLPAADKGTVELRVAGLKAGRYKVTTYRIGYRQNDAFTAWVKMGSPGQLTVAQVGELKGVSAGLPVSTAMETVGSGGLVKKMGTRTNDVWLVVIEPLGGRTPRAKAVMN